MKSLLRQADYSQAWVKDFYTQAAIWWGQDPQAAGTHAERVKLIERLCGSGIKRILDLGAPRLRWPITGTAWSAWRLTQPTRLTPASY